MAVWQHCSRLCTCTDDQLAVYFRTVLTLQYVAAAPQHCVCCTNDVLQRLYNTHSLWFVGA